MARFVFEMSDIHHKEWFIKALLSHIRPSLMQQRITTQSEALEISMKMEDSPIGENAIRMNHIQMHLVKLMLQLQDIKKGK